MNKPKMTLQDVFDDMKKRGFLLNYRSFQSGLEQGMFPFVRILGVGPSGRRTYMIFRKDYEIWADEYLGGYKV